MGMDYSIKTKRLIAWNLSENKNYRQISGFHDVKTKGKRVGHITGVGR